MTTIYDFGAKSYCYISKYITSRSAHFSEAVNY